MSTCFPHDLPHPPNLDHAAERREARQAPRVQAALTRIDPGDVLALIDERLAAAPDPTQHPLYHLVCWILERQLTPLDGGQFFDRWRQLVLAAVDTCLDDLLAMED